MFVYEGQFEKEFPNMPEHPIPYTFGVDIDLLSKFLNRDYIKNRDAHELEFTMLWQSIFLPLRRLTINVN